MSDDYQEMEWEIVGRLRTLLDRGLDKHEDRTLAEVIKDLARIVVREEVAKMNQEATETSDSN